ncbi:hypothetical protein LTR56_021518 [Elasticomyces elasticus]|nr:hypothetical protein LTR56_021518 [Elasticomyces elasticus]KAK3631257.1 hypothetical protein LTR22_021141 [Elasticomyces elasticus]KAK4909362.1 hypothetical protein LTR49_021874 [Elasticomyces elasticus]KAK5749390.1 hypothetical protein LTS12_020571 [Elasticomyces elasticus]
MTPGPTTQACRIDLEAVQSVTPSDNIPANQGEAGLLTIPPELRNAIYELIYDSPTPTGSVQLLEASSPSEAILLVCKQTFDEAKELYKDRCQQYWRNTRFTFSPAGAPLRLRFSETSVANIRHIHFAVQLAWLAPLVATSLSSNLAILERRADGAWYELSVNGVTTSPEDMLWCIPGGQRVDGESTKVRIVEPPEAINRQWQKLTTNELTAILVRKFEYISR